MMAECSLSGLHTTHWCAKQLRNEKVCLMFNTKSEFQPLKYFLYWDLQKTNMYSDIKARTEKWKYTNLSFCWCLVVRWMWSDSHTTGRLTSITGCHFYVSPCKWCFCSSVLHADPISYCSHILGWHCAAIWVRTPVTCYVTAGRTKRLNIDPYFDSVCTWRQSALSSVPWSTFVDTEVPSGPFMAVHHRGNLYCTSGGDSAPVKRSISWDQQLLKHSHKKWHMTQICPFFSL